MSSYTFTRNAKDEKKKCNTKIHACYIVHPQSQTINIHIYVRISS